MKHLADLKRLPIREKMLVIIMLTCIIGLLLAGTAFVVYDRYRVKRNMVEDVETLARLIADRSTAALTFDDPGLARENLAVLRFKPALVAAAIYKEDGSLFATYGSAQAEKSLPVTESSPTTRFRGDSLILFHPIVHDDKRLGTVYLQASLRELDVVGKQFLLITGLIIGGAGLIAWLVSNSLQRFISEPLTHLTRTAQQIATQKDYTVRARRESDDDIGILVEAFNEMLATIDGQNQMLITHRDHLEELVQARTAALKEANVRLQALDQLKSMFIASMSHELRTPLNSIIGFTGITLQGLSGDLNDEQRDNLSRAYNSGKHLLSLITDVIDISKIEAGRVEAFVEPVALEKIVAEAVDTVTTLLKTKNLALTVELPADIQLRTDRKRLLQCLINLLSNAVKYTEQGGVTISIREQGEEVEIAVADTGIGIAERDLPKLFEAFERLETHLKVKAGGTGLGLYLTRKLATDILHGSISVQSKEGAGSTFYLRIPKVIQPAVPAEAQEAQR